MSDKPPLFLVTSEYPNPGGDGLFVHPEIEELRSRFQLHIICLNKRAESVEEKEGVSYCFYEHRLGVWDRIKFFILFFGNLEGRKESLNILRQKAKASVKAIRLYQTIGIFACAERFYRFFGGYMPEDKSQKFIYYTFWNNYSALAMALHRAEYPNMKMVSRFHGYDLYDERFPGGRQPFKKLINEAEDRLFFVGNIPRRYYLERHLDLVPEKAIVRRLGTNQILRTTDEAGKKTENSIFRLVSCSSVIPLKRVELIVSALAMLEEPIEWIHFGAGSEYERVRQLAEAKLGTCKNIVWSMKGYVDNEAIRAYYADNSVDCFITTSSTEGCPVSIMEALAAGIPVIGTAVGEIPEMLADCGILLKEAPELTEIADAIREMIRKKENGEINRLRKNAYQQWENGYDAERNSRLFAEELLELIQ